MLFEIKLIMFNVVKPPAYYSFYPFAVPLEGFRSRKALTSFRSRKKCAINLKRYYPIVQSLENMLGMVKPQFPPVPRYFELLFSLYMLVRYPVTE